METERDFIFLSSKITADGDCSHEIKRRLLLGGKAMTNLYSILNKKQRHYFASKGPSSQSYGFSISHVWMWELDYKKSWAPKNWCFWTVVLEKTLERVPWTARRSNQSILKEISPEYPLKGLMLKLKLQYVGHLMRRTDSLEKTQMLVNKVGGERNDRGWDGWMASPMRWTWVWVGSRSWWWTGKPGCAVVHGVTESRTRLSDWTYLGLLSWLRP